MQYRLFDDQAEGYIRVLTFRVSKLMMEMQKLLGRFIIQLITYTRREFQNILKEIDEDFSEEELDGMFLLVLFKGYFTDPYPTGIIADIDIDGSGTIDFDEFCKIMTQFVIFYNKKMDKLIYQKHSLSLLKDGQLSEINFDPIDYHLSFGPLTLRF